MTAAAVTSSLGYTAPVALERLVRAEQATLLVDDLAAPVPITAVESPDLPPWRP